MVSRNHMPSRMEVLGVGAVLVFSGLGCGGSKPSLPALTADQKAEVSDTMSSAARAGYSAHDAAPISSAEAKLSAKVSLPPSLAFMSGLGFVQASPASPATSTDNARDAMRQRYLATTHCAVTASGFDSLPASTNPGSGTPSTGTPGTLPSFDQDMNITLSVKGSSCPATLDAAFSLNFTENQTTGSVTIASSLSATYAVSDATFRQLNDVDQFQITASLKAAGSQASGGSGSFTMSGSIHSQKHGTVTLTGNGTASGSGAQVTLDIVYPDFTAEIVAASTDGKTWQLTLNGESVTADQLKQILTSAQQ